MTHRKKRADALTDVLTWVMLALIALVVVAIVLGIRLAITGGDVGCIFANDPALCVAVKGAGR